MTESRFEVAVLVPCFNEERAIAKVVADFRAALPAARIYVYDNNSTDGTVAAAQQAGAVVRREGHQGKGYVVRRMFNDIEADIYVLVDGDATYDAPSAATMIDKLIGDRLDMVVGCRVDSDLGAYRPGHRAGNLMLTGFITHIFGRAFTDILSGYRVFSRRFVKSFPILSGGFEIETELTVHALELALLLVILPRREDQAQPRHDLIDRRERAGRSSLAARPLRTRLALRAELAALALQARFALRSGSPRMSLRTGFAGRSFRTAWT